MDISVYMPVYNGANFIKRCIDSVLASEFNGSFEFIIVDDGSEDNTVELIKEYVDERIKLFECEHKGIVEASNYGLEQCSGKYIARIDCDDEMLPNALQVRYDFLENNLDYGFVCGDAYIINDEKVYQRYGRGFEITHEHLRKGMCVTHSCLMHRRDLGWRYTKKYEYAEDYHLLLVATLNGVKGRSLSNVICKYYKHPQQICSRLKSKNCAQANLLKLMFSVGVDNKLFNFNMLNNKKELGIS